MNESNNQLAVLDAPPAVATPVAKAGVVTAVFRWLGRTVPSLLVFTALGGLLWWGHHTGWTLPTFSALTGGARDQCAADWCADHGVPESVCVECRVDLLPRRKAYGWCGKHGIHECPLCHPEVAEAATRLVVTADDMARAQRALDFTERAENNGKCKLHERRLQFTSVEAVEKVGIDIEPVWTAPMIEVVAGNGEVVYDPTRMARLSAKVPGTAFWVGKQVGDPVRAGDVLAVVDAAEVGKAKTEFLQALVQSRLRAKNFESMKRIGTSGAVSQQAFLEQESALSEAQIRVTAAQQALTNLGLPVQPDDFRAVPDDQLADRLRFLGLPESFTRTLNPKATTGNLLAVVAPFDGMVVGRDLVASEVVDAARVLFVVVDTRQLWLNLDLRLEDTRLVKPGQEVRFRPDGGKEFSGRITWVATEADHKTRTVKVSAAVDNTQGQLKANTFGAGRIILREEPKAVVVPNGTVQWDGCCHVVFVRDRDFLKDGAPKVFHIRKVRPGATNDKHTEIVAGLLPGEVVVTKGSAALRAELLKNNLGEGCCAHK